jgi:hypothetical protein
MGSAYLSLADAQAETNPVSAGVIRRETWFNIYNLQPDTDYWVRFNGDAGIQGPIHTLRNTTTTATTTTTPTPTTTTTTTTRTTTRTATTTTSPKSCAATWKTLSAWPGGFLGEITVKNTSPPASSSWKVGWTWSGSARLTASYHATIGGTATSPTLTALDWNRVIQGGGSTVVQVQGTVTGPLMPPAITCTLT